MEQLANHDVSRALRTARILVVEDNFLILMELESALTDAGAESVWACRTVGEALRALDEQDVTAAILDVQLDRETSVPVAHRLAERGVPFVFYTARLDLDAIHAEWPDCTILPKPAERHTIVATMNGLLAP